MMNKLIFGRFIPGDSFIHKLDPRVKLLASFILLESFLANNWQSYLLAAVLRYLAFFFQN